MTFAAAIGLLVACSSGGSGGSATTSHTHSTDTGTTGSTHQTATGLPAIAGFPKALEPPDNPFSEAAFQLGRHLFHDVRLSGNGTQACAGCHRQSLAFTDGRATSIGSTGETHPRNAQPLANVVYAPLLTWANPVLTTLERQAEIPLFGDNPVEMGVNDANRDAVLARIAGDPRYPPLFAAAFPGQSSPITWTNVIKAISTFQRGIISSESTYDRYLRGQATLSDAAMRGLALFMGERAECFHCHGSFNFNDQVRHEGQSTVDTTFHNTGLYNIGGTGAFPFPNRGLFESTGIATDMGKFRAPSLRNVAVTAPYMHDGTMATLEEVLDFYAAGGRVIASGPHAGDGRRNPYKDDLIVNIQLSAADKADIIAFLKTLTDEGLLTNPRYADPFK